MDENKGVLMYDPYGFFDSDEFSDEEDKKRCREAKISDRRNGLAPLSPETRRRNAEELEEIMKSHAKQIPIGENKGVFIPK